MQNDQPQANTANPINRIATISSLCSELGAMSEDLENRLSNTVARLDGDKPQPASSETLAQVDQPGSLPEIERKLHYIRERLGSAITSINELEALG